MDIAQLNFIVGRQHIQLNMNRQVCSAGCTVLFLACNCIADKILKHKTFSVDKNIVDVYIRGDLIH